MKDFLDKYGRKDHPDVVDVIGTDEFYYITTELQGWVVPFNITGLTESEKAIHNILKIHRET